MNLESFTYMWLDENMDATQDNRETQNGLRKAINQFFTFDDPNKCERFVKKNTQAKLVLIVSGSSGGQIIPRIHDLSQLSSFYVYCQDKKANEQWAKRFHKLNGVFVEPSKLLNQVLKDQSIRTKLEDGAAVSIIKSSCLSVQARNATFMWFQLFIEVLLRMHHKSSDRKELVDICKNYYKENKYEMEIIGDFEKNYKAEKAIWWYTRDSCLYRLMNRALRVQDFDMLFVFRFFITDIAKQLRYQYDKFIRTTDNRNMIRVYRGQIIANEEFKMMQNSIGEFLSMNSFLSTSSKRIVAVDFALQSPINDDSQRILFEIDIDPRLETKHFANITETSYFQEEDEVLITLGALFNIKKVVKDEEIGIWIAHLSLADEDDFHLKEMFSYMKNAIGDDADLDSLGKILIEMGEPEQARKCYERMLNETKLTLGRAEIGLGVAYLDCSNEADSSKHLQQALNIRQELLGPEDPEVAECYCHIGTLHWLLKHDYQNALIHLKQAVEVQEKRLPADSFMLARTYHNMGTTYNLLKEYDLALHFFRKTLAIREKILPRDHPHVGSTYNNLGTLYTIRRDYTTALAYFTKSFEILRKTLPPTHRNLIRLEQDINDLKKRIKK